MTELSMQYTPLNDLHLRLNARMVPFAGYSMPVQYPDGVLKEHLHTRQQAGLFDVSHMGQIRIDGAERARLLEQLVPVDVIDLPVNRQRYALFTHAEAGILDDLMITNMGDHLFVVVNAGCKQADLAHLKSHLEPQCQVTMLTDQALLALQGPQAEAALKRHIPDVANMVFMDALSASWQGVAVLINRSGYTGEDGFEISIPASHAVAFAELLLAEPEVAPIGLGARDSLRLEAGLCLYGHDIDSTITPIEANLLWAINKVRRPDGARAGGYPGSERVAQQIADGCARVRVALAVEGRAPVREGAEIVDQTGKVIGAITSGGFAPSLNVPIAMGYVERDFATNDAAIFALVRGKMIALRVTKAPFVANRYKR